MKRFLVSVIAALFLSFLIIPPANAQGTTPPAERDPVAEQEIIDRLAATEPDAVPFFEAATDAMDSGDLAAAEIGFGQVLDMAPDFPDALRRLSYVEGELGKVDAAIEHARRAYEMDDSPVNQSSLAWALLLEETPRSNQEALTLAWDASRAEPDDEFNAYVLIVAGMMNEDISAVRRGVETLQRVMPDAPETHFFNAIVQAEDGNFLEAEREAERARELGMPSEVVDSLLYDAGVGAEARTQRLTRLALYSVGGWIGALGVLFVAGAVLSGLTMAAVRRARPGEVYEAGPGERVVRTVYRVVIFLASLYYYISIPFLLLITVGLAGGIIYLFISLGRVPIKLLAIVAIAALYTLFAVVRSIFTRVKQKDPGPRLSAEDAPELWALLEQVAERVGTRPVDTVFITPLSDIAVTERGGLLRKLMGQGDRTLILGLAALPDMTQSQFKAILAHEYGHFSNRDTAGGNLAAQVRASMKDMAYGLATKGQASWINPVWLFLNAYNRVFLRITLGASRLQEILADRYAALAYGARNLRDALHHLVRRTLNFQVQASKEIEAALKEQRSPANLYALPAVEDSTVLRDIDKAIQEALNRPTSAYDSHPSIKDRTALLEALAPTTPHDQDTRPALDLLRDPARWQDRMSQLLFAGIVRRHR